MMINNIKEKIKKFGITETIVLIIYIIIVLFLATTHECYQEEAQSWLIARDLNIVEIIQQLKYEGHSFLWYYILMPFAKLGFPMQTQNYISAIFAIATIFLILKKAPFGKILKILITFSGGMIYFYSVIARPYCLIPLLLVCIAITYKKRREHPYIYAIFLALLAHTHLVMLPTVIMLTIFFWGEELIIKRKEKTKEEKKKLLKSLLIVSLSIIIFLLICVQAVFNCEIVNNLSKIKNIGKANIEVFQLIKDAITVTSANLYGKNIVPVYYKIVLAIPFVLCLIATKNSIRQASVFWTQCIFTLLIHAFFWRVMPVRLYIVIYTLMFWIWIYNEENNKKNHLLQVALIILIIITALPVYKLAYQDIIGNYSTGKMTAQYIQENIEEGTCFICTENETYQSIIGYLKKDSYKFYMLNSQDYITYITWNEEWNTKSNIGQLQETISNLKEKYNNVYILSLFSNNNENIELIYNTKNQIINSIYNQNGMENYYIYKVIY